MATRTYTIVFEVNEGNAIRGIDLLMKKLEDLDAKAKTVGTDFKNFLGGMPNTTGIDAVLKSLQASLGAISSSAATVTADLGKVGSDRTNLKAYEAEVLKLIADIKGLPTGPKMPGATSRSGAGASQGAIASAAMIPGAGKLLAAGLGVRIALQKVAASSTDQRERMQASSALVQDMRASLQELANLQAPMGAGEVTEQTIRDQLAFQLETGTTMEQSIAFREQFQSSLGSGQARGNITDKVAKQTEKDIATFMVRTKMDPAIAGKLSGNIAEYQKIQGEHDVLGQFAEIGYYLEKFGIGKMADIAGPMQELRGRFLDVEGGGGKFSSEADMALMYALTTNRGPKSPAANKTMMVQAQRMLRRFDGETGEALRNMGITPEMDYLTALRQIQPIALGKNADIDLMNMSFSQSTERASVIRQANVLQAFDKLKGDEKFQKEIQVAKDNALRENERFLNSQAGQDIRAETAQLIQTVNEGLGVGKLQRAMESSRARLLQQEKNKLFGTGTVSGNLADYATPITTLGLYSGEEARLENEAFLSITQQARARGIDVIKSYPELGRRMTDPTFTREQRSELYDRIYNDVVARGGNPGAYELEQAAKLLQEGAQKLNANQGPPAMLQPGNGFDAARGGP